MANPLDRRDVGERRAAAQAGIRKRAAAGLLASFFIAGGLLNGRHMYEEASRRPYGRGRDAWLRATAPLRAAAAHGRLDALRNWVERTWRK